MSNYAMYGAQLRYELVAGQQAEARAAAAAERQVRALGREGPSQHQPELTGWRRVWRAGIAAIAARCDERHLHEKSIRDAGVLPLS